MIGWAVRDRECAPQLFDPGEPRRNASAPLAAREVLRLQRSVGNRVTSRLLARYPDATAAKIDTGLDDVALARALTGMTLIELQAFKNDVGDAARLRELVVLGELTGENLKHYGGVALKTLKVDDETMNHLLTPEFSSKAGVKGQHDLAAFQSYLTDPAVSRPGVEEHTDANSKKKYRAVLQGGAPSTFQGRGQIRAQTPHATDPDITHVTYDIYTQTTANQVIVHPAGQPLAGQPIWKKGYEKTVIRDLSTNRAVWQERANRALYDALRAKQAKGVGKFQGADGNGVTFEFWARANKIDTFYPLL
jgi:hypothetical protein